jgi:hypothetical protein
VYGRAGPGEPRPGGALVGPRGLVPAGLVQVGPVPVVLAVHAVHVLSQTPCHELDGGVGNGDLGRPDGVGNGSRVGVGSGMPVTVGTGTVGVG